MEVPLSLIVNTGEQHTVRLTIDDFFDKTRSDIMSRYGRCPCEFFEVKSLALAQPSPASESRQITDDQIEYLTYRGLVVAGVLETRTESNCVQYTFFSNVEILERT